MRKLPLFTPAPLPPTDYDTPDPLCVSLGLGVDSVAMLVGFYKRGIRPDWIGWADVGNEWPETYAYRPILDAWLAKVGFPAITEVRYQVQNPRNGHYTTLEENCLVNWTLPGISFGYKSCSVKWKGAPLDAAVRATFAKHIKGGGRVLRAIGYDAGACDMKRGTSESKGPWRWVYPLREWGWDRERCIAEIRSVGLPVPHKSACWFCKSMQESEALELATNHPHLARRAVIMEDNARPRLREIQGLWGRDRKGMRGTTPRPGSWRAFYAVHAPHVLPEATEWEASATIPEISTFELKLELELAA